MLCAPELGEPRQCFAAQELEMLGIPEEIRLSDGHLRDEHFPREGASGELLLELFEVPK
jgi:hypothetical protein